jgi:hypothetical protein
MIQRKDYTFDIFNKKINIIKRFCISVAFNFVLLFTIISEMYFFNVNILAVCDEIVFQADVITIYFKSLKIINRKPGAANRRKDNIKKV